MKTNETRSQKSKAKEPIKPAGESSSGPSARKPTLLVAGDAAIDWFLYPVSADAGPTNWRQLPAMHSRAVPGGVCLLTHFLKQIVEVEGGQSTVLGPELKNRQLREFSPDKVIHSNAILEDPDAGDEKKRNQRLRIGHSLGFMGPAQGSPQFRFPTSSTPSADVIVLDDVGNGFRNDQRAWPSALKGANQPWVVHKMSSPLAEGSLWDALAKSPSEKRLVVVTAEALRQVQEVQISSGLSWERTARDFVFQIQRSPDLRTLQQCPYLVVLFGVEGAILYRGGDLETPSTLIFDPIHLEGQYQDTIPGTVFGMTALITAAIASSLAAEGIEHLEEGIKSGLHFARCFLERGYPRDPSARFPRDPSARFLPNAGEWRQCPKADANTFATCLIERPNSYQEPDPGFWRILDAKTRNSRLIAAEEVVIRGKAAGLSGIPIGKFGKLQTIDRAEIESYNAIRRLIGEFLAEPKPERPLSFAVFGPPGSGKSFGVKQVMASLARKDLESVTFNISQFRSYQELVSSLHRVRDIVLSGRIPFVFFDEFDAGFEGQTLGWLKYFLAPMQDGEFKDGESVYHIGRAVFVFAGGTRSCFDDFVMNRPPLAADAAENNSSSSGSPDYDRAVYGAAAFRQAKGPDFASRLRGFIDIMGPNRQDPKDDAFIIRRANVLRSMLEKLRNKADRLFKPGGRELRIDPGVLRAMLNIGEYRHGIRSMEAIIGMSRLAGRTCFDLSALPPKDQLDLHVDAEEFLFLAERERFVNLIPPRDFPAVGTPPAGGAKARETALVESLARSIHEEYTRQRSILGQKGSLQAWDDLSEEKRNSNRDAASHIPTKLRLVGHGVRRIGESAIPRTPDISDKEILILAQAEHERWAGEQKLQGFRYGKEKDLSAKVSPHLVPFDELTPDVQAYDIQAVEAIPRCLAQAGLEIYRMTEVDRLSDPALIDRLARSIHEDYVRQRTKEGDTPASNPSLVPFEQLKGDLLEANLDNARSIPRKLREINFGIRRAPGHRAPTLLVLDSSQVETLAEMEHSRWNWQKLLQGWIYAPPPKDLEKKTTPHLVPWARLPDEIREYDRETVRLIPALLMQAGYEAYPLAP